MTVQILDVTFASPNNRPTRLPGSCSPAYGMAKRFPRSAMPGTDTVSGIFEHIEA